MKNVSFKTISTNKKAYHDYFVIEKLETGIELAGTEVKSIRKGKVSLKESWCSIIKGEIFVNGLHISPYEKGNIFNKDSLRVRKLLVHKKEILKLSNFMKQDGFSIVPLSLYLKGSLVKLQIGICKGKKLYDKRASLAEKSAKLSIQRALREKNR